VTEAIAEQKDSKEPLFMATLDSQKAFDVVDHASLMWKWHELGLKGILWQLKDLTYQDMTTRVKWKGHLSEPFSINQGVRQGGIPSTVDYKAYIDPLLHELENSGTGLHIGATYVGAPTCADDVMLLSDSPHSLQYQLTVAESYAAKERYTIHPTKTEITAYHTKIPNEIWNTLPIWTLHDNPVPVTQLVTHLGVLRESEKSTTISKFVSERLKVGRGSLYALMGAGLHGLNGLSPITSHKLYTTYVLPRLLSGMETITLNQTELNALEHFHRSTLRQIQNLPPRTAIPGIYILLGALPLEAELDKRRLTLFGAISRDPDTKLGQIALRQLIMKPQSSNSWFTQITEILYKYGLPSPLDIMANPSTKGKWKSQIQQSVNYYWCTKLKMEARSKSTLQYLTVGNMGNKPEPHPLWTSINFCTLDIQRASYHAKMLTGTYTLQMHRNRYTEGAEPAACPLCQSGYPEDIHHFLTTCENSKHIRDKFKEDTNISGEIENSQLVQLVLDSSQYQEGFPESFRALCRLYMFRLHYNRAQILGYRPYPGAKLQPTTTATDTAVAVAAALAEGGGGDDRTGGGDRAYRVLHK
jgi:hypothetical protein